MLLWINISNNYENFQQAPPLWSGRESPGRLPLSNGMLGLTLKVKVIFLLPNTLQLLAVGIPGELKILMHGCSGIQVVQFILSPSPLSPSVTLPSPLCILLFFILQTLLFSVRYFLDSTFWGICFLCVNDCCHKINRRRVLCYWANDKEAPTLLLHFEKCMPHRWEGSQFESMHPSLNTDFENLTWDWVKGKFLAERLRNCPAVKDSG